MSTWRLGEFMRRGHLSPVALGFAVAAASLGVPNAAWSAKPITVCSSNCTYSSIQSAIDAAPIGASIKIEAGTYLEDVHIAKDLKLTGAGLDQTILESIITIDPCADVIMKSVTVTDKGIEGFSGIENSGTLAIANSVVSGSCIYKGKNGHGAIYNNGTLTLKDSTVTQNNCRGIFNSGTARLDSSTVSENGDGVIWEAEDLTCFVCIMGGGGIANTGTLILNDSTVGGNVMYGVGGGISSSGDLTLNNSIVSGNSSYYTPDSGGPIPGFGPGYGGGIVATGTVRMSNSIISDNTSHGDDGGGVVFDNAEVTLKATTISNNLSEDQGGGIIIRGGGMVAMIGTTVGANTSSTSEGGGVYIANGQLALLDSSITGNSAFSGGGIFNNPDNPNAEPVLADANSNVVDNTPDNCQPANLSIACK